MLLKIKAVSLLNIHLHQKGGCLRANTMDDDDDVVVVRVIALQATECSHLPKGMSFEVLTFCIHQYSG